MNCHEFEDFVVDLARGVVADSTVGTRCWAHAAICPRCADRLLDQEKLTAGFEALTAHTDAKPELEQVEAILRREFRSHFAKNDGRVASRPTTWDYPMRAWMSPGQWAWVGAAAVLLLSTGGLLTVTYRTKLPTAGTANNLTVTKSIESGPAIAKSNATGPNVEREHSKARVARENSVSETHQSVGEKNNSTTPERPAFHSTAHDELATNFYPLPYGSGLPLDEGWEIVRVSMPRSALANLGVPLAGDPGSTESIRADLVLGEDGLARAIRFVE
ncbi:MAG TPA: hypothetical protein VKV95_15715 [Terriglobia bacterium]|nr:hypothetical protein [Terriglobia bacterium]